MTSTTGDDDNDNNSLQSPDEPAARDDKDGNGDHGDGKNVLDFDLNEFPPKEIIANN